MRNIAEHPTPGQKVLAEINERGCTTTMLKEITGLKDKMIEDAQNGQETEITFTVLLGFAEFLKKLEDGTQFKVLFQLFFEKSKDYRSAIQQFLAIGE